MRKTIRRFCPAKINLFLEVLGKRDDGFHEIVTVMAPIDFGDTLVVRPGRELRLRVRPAGSAPVAGNTVLHAARALRRRAGFRGGAELTLLKRVPAGSGLGGGSSDAAAALLALDDLLDLRSTKEELAGAAAEVGSDVPFFLQPRPALAAGRGELISPVPTLPSLHLVLVLPPVAVSTAAVYGRVRLFLTRKRKDVNKFLNTRCVPGPSKTGNVLYNALEKPALCLHPQLRRWGRMLRDAGLPALMSGSGSAFFGLCPSRARADRIARTLERSAGTRILAASSRGQAGAGT